jgi:hypothetical protein
MFPPRQRAADAGGAGNPEETPWCRGQVVFFGGSTSAERDPAHPAYPDGYLGDLWIYNVSSNTITGMPPPLVLSGHAASLTPY